MDQLDGDAPGSYLDGANFKTDGHWQQPTPQWNNESPDALLEEEQLQRCINRTLNLLPPAQKAAFILRDIEQQSFEDICNILAVSAANVRVLVHRARLTLMQVIDRYQEDWLMLSCKQVATIASDYLDHSTSLKWQIRLHLLMCAQLPPFCPAFENHPTSQRKK